MKRAKDIDKLLRGVDIIINPEVDKQILAKVLESRRRSGIPARRRFILKAVSCKPAYKLAAVAAVIVVVAGAVLYLSLLREAQERRVHEADTVSDRAIAAAMPVLPEPGPGEVRLVKDLDGMQTNGHILDSGLVQVSFDEGLMWQYEGGKYMEFRQEGPLVFLSTDGGPENLVGLKLEEPNQLVLFDAESGRSNYDRFAIWCYVQPPAEISQLGCADKITFFQQVKPNDLYDLNPLAGLVNLEVLYAKNIRQDCKAVRDLSALSDLPRLKALALYGFANVESICELGPDLVYADFGRSDSLKNISSLGELSELEWLDLSSCSEVTDFSALAGLTKLRLLELRHTRFSDLSTVRRVANLVYLGLAGTEVQDLSPLANSTGLEKLNLGSCRNVSDLQPLANLKSLRELNLSVCRGITDISPLGSLERLEMLDLSACGSVSSIEALAGLVNLRKLNLSWCGLISDLTPVGELPRLTTLEIRGCPKITDIQCIREPIGRGVALYASRAIEEQATEIRREILSDYAMAASAIVWARVSASDGTMTGDMLVLSDLQTCVTKVLYGDVAKGTLRGGFSIGNRSRGKKPRFWPNTGDLTC
jgi:Leucine-rich repeat (LRR) protein